jgi:ketosteroid isomerase-like protein
MSAWKEFRGEAEEYRELDDERTLVLHRFSGRGESSGLELEQMQATGATVYHVRANKVVRMVVYFDRDRALADLGLASGAN